MKVSDSGNSGDFEQPEPGSYAATCYKVIDLGTQTNEYQGKTSKRRQVVIGWELELFMADRRPFAVSAFYTASLHKEANLRKTLDSWRGEPFTPEQLKDGFDLRKVIGAPCLVNVIMTDKGKAKVGAVLKLPKGMPKPEKHNSPIYFSLDEFDNAVFAALTPWYQKKIAESPEYQKLFQGQPAGAGADNVGEEDIPF